MNRVLHPILFVFLLFGSSYAPAQEYNSLLWRISGKGLSSPSYLYGTMHLTDKRIFNFPDSLYHSLEQCKGFASEVDMGELMSELGKELNDEERDAAFIKDLVSPKLTAPYREKLAKTFNKKFETITWGEVSALKSEYSSELLKKGEMPTVMDAWLFDVAKRQGKWVGGIEDYADQVESDKEKEVMSALDEIFSDKRLAKEKLEWMTGIYLNQQLDSIDITSQLWRGAERNVLIRRNVKMARRIDSIMQFRTCLFAVGAAHIPGNSGVVKLLRDRGFKVEPVLSSHRVPASEYTYKAIEIPWEFIEVKDNWYSVQMPGKPSAMKLDYDIPGMNTQFYFDLAKLNAYFSFSFPIERKKNIDTDSIYASMAKNFSKNGKILSSKTVTINGIPGKEFLSKTRGNDLRLQVFLPPSGVVVNTVSSFKYDSLFGSDAKRFFESFHVLKEPEIAQKQQWQLSSFPENAFSIKFPTEYKNQSRSAPIDSAWKTDYYVSNTQDGALSCWMIVMAAKPGYFSDSDSGYFSLLRKNLSERFGQKADVTQSWSRSSFSGYPCLELFQKMKYKDGLLQLKGRVINRGNRRYFFYAVATDDEKGSTQADMYLNSFEFLPLPLQLWETHLSAPMDIEAWTPGPIQTKQSLDTTREFPDYIIYDSVSATSILIRKQYLSPYSWWTSDSSFFRERANHFTDEQDSVKEFKMSHHGEIGEADFYVSLNDNHLVKKVHLLLNGDTLYTVFCFTDPKTLNDKNYVRLFNTIKVVQAKQSGFHLAHKTDRILRDLADGDSATFESAFDALKTASFTIDDLSKLQNAILREYRDFAVNDYGVHRQLIGKILETDQGSTFNFIKNNYNTLEGSREKLKYSLLYCLLSLKTKESFSLFKEIVSKKLPGEGNVELLGPALNDSLSLTASIFADILKISTDTTFIKILPPVVNNLLDSGWIDKKILDPYKENFYALINRDLKRLKKELPDYDYSASQDIKLLSHFNETTSYGLLQQFLALPGLNIKERAAIALIKCHQKADLLQLEKIARDDYYRITLYEDLEELKQQKLFPPRYSNQQLIARSEIYQYASDDYEPDSVLFIGEKTASFLGKQKRFYLFKIVYKNDEGEESYLGVTGPYPISPGKVITRSGISGLYDSENYNAKKISAQFRDYLRQMEESMKEQNK